MNLSEILTEKNYKILNNDNKNIIYLEIDSKNFIIKYENNNFYINNIIIDTKTNLKDKLNDYLKYDCNFLIYCHPRPYDTHWQIDYFHSITQKLGFKNVKYSTLDIINKPDILADGFKGEFIEINSKYPIYDIVILPDCGGDWYLKNDDTITIFNIINNILKIIKEGGKLYLSKIIEPINIDVIYQEFNKKYKCEIENFKFSTVDIKYLVITKNNNSINKLEELIDKYFSLFYFH